MTRFSGRKEIPDLLSVFYFIGKYYGGIMSKKLSYEFVKSEFAKSGCTLISTCYVNYKTKMEYICSCGNNSEICYGNFRSGKRCKACSPARISDATLFSISKVRKEFCAEGCLLLADEYKGSDKTLKYICSCGSVAYTTRGNFLAGKRCKECKRVKIANALKLNIGEVKKYFSDNGCTLLDTEYTNAHKVMQYICECGNAGTINFDNFKNGKRCKQCAILRNTGAGNPSWNPDLTDEDRAHNRNYLDYTQWRKAVCDRDKYTCQKCGNKKSKFHVHHIASYRDYKHLRTDVSNGVTLCKECHLEFHSTYSRNSFTPEDYLEFINEESIKLVI